ncbi:phage tail protein [Fluviicola sp.]|uniref:phage tail protein n=1 Tax=Fluviicola sp. TaxID=1917219 RepID=UPI003D288956
MSTEPFIGEVKIFGFSFSPIGYDYCKGQLYSIAQYTALFSLIGTTYGGDGQTTFALPDLQGRIPIGQGQGPGLPDYTMGEAAGSPTVTMTTAEMPAHIHTLNSLRVSIKASNDAADENAAAGLFPGVAASSVYTAAATPNVFTGGTQVVGTTDPIGSGMPFSIVNPYLVLNYCIATEGIFPSRN